MTQFTQEGEMNEKVWYTLHSISHIFEEASQILVTKGAISQENQFELVAYGQCLSHSKLEQSDLEAEVQTLFQKSYVFHNADRKSVV